MSRLPKIFALILARAGSRRLPGKNRKRLGGKPLVVWSIEAARGVPGIVATLVSTDDPAVARISRRQKALVPWLRPRHLASARASSSSAALHALNWYEKKFGKVDGILLLQPTSPFRKKASIRKAISLFKKNRYLPVISVLAVDSRKPIFFRQKNGLCKLLDKKVTASGPAPELFVPNGNLYLCSPKHLREEKSFFGKRIIPLPMSSETENLDIDTQDDFSRGQLLVATSFR
jgi:CMP-N,N'-diacetyllegionaminic acid synthase